MDVKRVPLPRSLPEWVLSAAIAGAYLGCARFGISLSVAQGVITPVWAPSGIALVALLLLGGRFWPAVAVGAFSANVASGAGASVAAAIVFVAGGWRYPYLIFPVLVFAVLRFRQLGAAAGTLIVGAFGTLGTANGWVPISAANATERVQVIQALIAITAVTLLLLAATLAEREAAGEALRLESER